MARRPRWIAIGVFVLSSSLNYLDRLLLAALAPASSWNSVCPIRIAGSLLLLTAAVPLLKSPLLAGGVSFFWRLAISANFYAVSIDFFGARRAAFGVSLLTCSYGRMQTALSPAAGFMVNRLGFAAVSLAPLPLAGVAVLRISVHNQTNPSR